MMALRGFLGRAVYRMVIGPAESAASPRHQSWQPPCFPFWSPQTWLSSWLCEAMLRIQSLCRRLFASADLARRPPFSNVELSSFKATITFPRVRRAGCPGRRPPRRADALHSARGAGRRPLHRLHAVAIGHEHHRARRAVAVFFFCRARGWPGGTVGGGGGGGRRGGLRRRRGSWFLWHGWRRRRRWQWRRCGWQRCGWRRWEWRRCKCRRCGWRTSLPVRWLQWTVAAAIGSERLHADGGPVAAEAVVPAVRNLSRCCISFVCCHVMLGAAVVKLDARMLAVSCTSCNRSCHERLAMQTTSFLPSRRSS